MQDTEAEKPSKPKSLYVQSAPPAANRQQMQSKGVEKSLPSKLD
jgi:hypothetical protein